MSIERRIRNTCPSVPSETTTRRPSFSTVAPLAGSGLEFAGSSIARSMRRCNDSPMRSGV
jgi:hypothetical protein